MRLYELTGHYLALQERAEEGEDVAELLAQIDDALEEKAHSMLKLMTGLKGDIETLRAEEDRIGERRARLEKTLSSMLSYLKEAMVAGDIRSIKCGSFSLALRDGPPKVIVEDFSKLEPQYIREKTTREPDKLAILAEYKAHGVIAPGCDVVREPSLVIK